jgi:short-subunit dehydrogenase
VEWSDFNAVEAENPRVVRAQADHATWQPKEVESMGLDIAQDMTVGKETGTRPAIVVTGAASGIGREIARLAAIDDSFLLLVDRSCQQVNDFVAELAADGVKSAAVCIDLTAPDALQSIESALSERELYCDILVNSAGFGVFGPAAKVSEREQMSLVDVNVRALTALTLRFLPGMVARGRGGVLNLGSITGYAPGPNMAVYYASKAFVNSFSAALAIELAGTGVTVTCLAPGIVTTPFFERCPEAQTRMYDLMPQSSTIDVATAGWVGFKAGKRMITPHWRNKLVISTGKVLPQGMVLQLLGFLQRPR